MPTTQVPTLTCVRSYRSSAGRNKRERILSRSNASCRHKQAVIYAKQAIMRLDNMNETEQMRMEENPMERKNWFTTKAVAYYNLGVEFEHMAMMQDAVTSYGQALEIAQVELGEESGLTVSI